MRVKKETKLHCFHRGQRKRRTGFLFAPPLFLFEKDLSLYPKKAPYFLPPKQTKKVRLLKLPVFLPFPTRQEASPTVVSSVLHIWKDRQKYFARIWKYNPAI